MNTPQTNARVLERIEWAAAVAITLGLLILHFVVWRNAGDLWRDEINTATVAQTPSIAESWRLMPFESAPFLFHFLLRGWTAVFGGSDTVLRLFGFLVGVGVVAALWLNARIMGRSLPLISLAIFGMNSVAIRFGDSVRFYGLGVFFMLMTVALVWRLVTYSNRLSLVLATASAVAAVQSLYQNAFFVFAICLAGMAVTSRRRLWKQTWQILAVGGIAAIFLLPYLPIINHAQQYLALYQFDFGYSSALTCTANTLNSSGVFMAGTWGVLLIAGACIAIAAQFPVRSGLPAEKRDLALYAGVASTVSLVCFCIFWKTSKLNMSPWYTLLPLALLAVFLDAMAAVLPAARWRRFLVLGLSAAIVAASYPTVWKNSHGRHTNMGGIARELARVATRDDLIVVTPWYLGTTFQRYYKGAAAWITVPELDNYDIQREDQLKRKLATPDAAGSALEKISRALKSGNEVWIVCQIEYDAKHLPKVLTSLRPAPQEPRGWYADPYLVMWAKEMWQILEQHGRYVSSVVETRPNPGQNENIPLIVYKGWK